MGAFDFMGSTNPQTGSFQFNPNFINMMAEAGAGFSQGKGAGEILGGVAMNAVRNSQTQKAASGMVNNLQGTPEVTPKGQEGPDEIITKQTAEGTATTVKTPSAAQLRTYGTSVPVEAVNRNMDRIEGGQKVESPFWKALLGQTRQ